MRIIVATAACALAVAACTKADQGTPAAGGAPGTHAGELRVGIQRAPNTLNPLLSAFTTEGFVNRLSFDVLVSIDSDGKTPVPELATEVPTPANGGISRDGLTITYHLRRGVKWQDGAPFTSKDVAFSWRAMMNDKNNVNERVGYEEVRSIATPDDATVVFHLRRKFAPFVNTVFAESDSPVCIVPEHLLAKYPDVNKIPFNQAPIGTGPFKVVEWQRGDHISLVANDGYWRGKPKLRRIIVREIPDENTEINALRAHDIDFMFQPSPQTYNTLKTIPGIKIVLDQGPTATWLLMNTEHPPLDDVRVRRAIVHAVDKDQLVARFTGGSATVAWADQPRYSWAYDSNVARYPHDVAAAKALLAQAGWTPGPSGIAQKNGRPLTLQLSYNVENATRRLVAVQMQSDLRQIGVDAQIKAYPANLYFATYGQGGILNHGKFDLTVSGWVAGIDPDDHSLLACDQIPRRQHPDGANYSRYCSAGMDDLQRRALTTYDQPARTALYHRIQEQVARDVPIDYIWFQVFPQAINPAFRGFAPNPINESWNAWQWEI